MCTGVVSSAQPNYLHGLLDLGRGAQGLAYTLPKRLLGESEVYGRVVPGTLKLCVSLCFPS